MNFLCKTEQKNLEPNKVQILNKIKSKKVKRSYLWKTTKIPTQKSQKSMLT